MNLTALIGSASGDAPTDSRLGHCRFSPKQEKFYLRRPESGRDTHRCGHEAVALSLSFSLSLGEPRVTCDDILASHCLDPGGPLVVGVCVEPPPVALGQPARRISRGLPSDYSTVHGMCAHAGPRCVWVPSVHAPRAPSPAPAPSRRLPLPPRPMRGSPVRRGRSTSRARYSAGAGARATQSMRRASRPILPTPPASP